VNFKFLSLLIFVSLHFAISSQDIIDITDTIPSLDSTSYTHFLQSLPDSTSSKINRIQTNLESTQDTLDHLSNLAQNLKSQFSDQKDQLQTESKLNPFIENVGFLYSEVNNLKQAITNLQTSDEVDYELAYIIEIETMLNQEVDRLSLPQIDIPVKTSTSLPHKKSALKNNDEDLSNYTFDTHPNVSAQLNAFKDCSLKKIIDGKEYTPLTYFFDYTPEKLQSHFQHKDYILAYGQVVKSEKLYFFNMQIKIHSNLARDTYGGIEKGSALRFEFINGDKIILYNLKRDFGVYNDESEKMVYDLVYSIKKDDLKSLENLDLDKIGIIWTTGYEDYKVYETDFLINHIHCLNKKN